MFITSKLICKLDHFLKCKVDMSYQHCDLLLCTYFWNSMHVYDYESI